MIRQNFEGEGFFTAERRGVFEGRKRQTTNSAATTFSYTRF
jgi:hypothetical protein